MRQLLALAALAGMCACDSKPSAAAASAVAPASPSNAAATPAEGAFPKAPVTYYFGGNEAMDDISFASKTEITNIIGHTHKVTGEATIDFEAGSGRCKVVVPTASLNSGMPDRDNAMHGKTWLDSKKFATIEFESTKAARAKPPIGWKIDGKFTFHGVTQDLSIDADVKPIRSAVAKKYGLGEGDCVKVTTNFKIKLADYGIAIDKSAIATVEPVWSISIDIIGSTVKPPETADVKPAGNDVPFMQRVADVETKDLTPPLYKFGKKPQLTTIKVVTQGDIASITAQNSALAGRIALDKDKNPAKARFRLKVDHFTTGVSTLDNDLRSPAFLDSKQFPEITFDSTKFTKKSGDVWSVEGNLALHGVTKPLAFEVRMREISQETVEKAHWGDQPGLGFDATFKIKASDFGIKAPDALAARMKDEWTVTLSLTALLEEENK